MNPIAGSGRSLKVWKRFLPYLATWQGTSINVSYTKGPRHATDITLDSLKNSVDRVVAVGGDGTVQEVANALASNGSSAALAVIPAGKGNDFARSIGMPRSLREIAKELRNPATQTLDLGWISTPQSSRYFMNMIGIGFDGEVSRMVNLAEERAKGRLAYLWWILKKLASYKLPKVKMFSPNLSLEGKSILIAAGNTPYCGGGIKLVPWAKPDDGRLGVVWCGDVGPLEALRFLPTTFKGNHIGHPKVTCLDIEEMTVVTEEDREVWIHADGEVAGTLPATIKVVPAAIKAVDVKARAPA